jgi:hypothetical protein
VSTRLLTLSVAGWQRLSEGFTQKVLILKSLLVQVEIGQTFQGPENATKQSHNLKVIGSNPIPATKIDKNPAISIDCWVFVFKVEPSPNKVNGLVSQVQIPATNCGWHNHARRMAVGFLVRRLHQIHSAMFFEGCREFGVTPLGM